MNAAQAVHDLRHELLSDGNLAAAAGRHAADLIAARLEDIEAALTAREVPVPAAPFPVRGGCGQNGDGSWATDGHGCPVCGAYGVWDGRPHHGGGSAGSPGCPNRALVYDYAGDVVG